MSHLVSVRSLFERKRTVLNLFKWMFLKYAPYAPLS